MCSYSLFFISLYKRVIESLRSVFGVGGVGICDNVMNHFSKDFFNVYICVLSFLSSAMVYFIYLDSVSFSLFVEHRVDRV